MNNAELEACIQAYGRDVYSFCRHLTGSIPEADDLYQDTFLKLVEIRDEVVFELNPKSYILSVAVHIWQNRKRKFALRQRITGPRLSLDDEDTPEMPSLDAGPEETVISEEEKRLVREAVQRLPDRYRIPVILYYMEGLSVAGISGVTGVPKGTVKSRLHRAKQLLGKELEVVLNETRA